MRLMFKWLLAALSATAATAGGVHAETYVATPGRAAEQLAKLRAGDTLILKPGVYRETLDIRNRQGSEKQPIVVRGDTTGGRVILRGSDVLSKWKSLGKNLYAHALETQPTQLFVNGTAYQQVGGTVFDGYPTNRDSEYHRLHKGDGGVWPGRVAVTTAEELPVRSFMYDEAAKRVLVRTDEDLPGALVEASQRPRLFFAQDVRYLVVDNLELQHANTSATTRGGALVVLGDHITLRNLRASWNDLAGLQFGGDHVRLEDSESSYNGQVGVMGYGRYAQVTRVKVSYNNRRGFNKWWEAGGFKFIGYAEGALRSSSVKDCQALFNRGDGIWFDWKNNEVDIGNNLSAYNQGFGIHYEASASGMIHDNILLGNQQRGVYLSSSRNTLIKRNLVVGNGLEGIVSILQDGLKDEDGNLFRANGVRVEDNILAWNENGAIILPGSDGISEGNVFWGEGVPSRFSVGYTNPLNLPVYGVDAWNRLTGQDRTSWWLNTPRPKSWTDYLAAKSTELAPLKALVAQSRAAPPASEHLIRAKAGLGLSSLLNRGASLEALPAVGPAGL